MKIILTIDDSPTKNTYKRMEFLDSLRIKAVWFCLGERIGQNVDVCQQLIRNGHIIGNHGYHHLHFSRLTLKEAKKNIIDCDKIINLIYAGTPRPAKYFRFPFYDRGGINEAQIQQVLFEAGYQPPPFDYKSIVQKNIDWGTSYCSGDTNPNKTVQKVTAKIKKHIYSFQPISIVSVHDLLGDDSAACFESIIKTLLDYAEFVSTPGTDPAIHPARP